MARLQGVVVLLLDQVQGWRVNSKYIPSKQYVVDCSGLQKRGPTAMQKALGSL